MATIVYRGLIAKFFSWTIFVHDFELYPFDRELSYDFVQILVMLLVKDERLGSMSSLSM